MAERTFSFNNEPQKISTKELVMHWTKVKILVVLGVFTIFVSSIMLYYNLQYVHVISDPQLYAQSELEISTKRISQFMDLPDEIPQFSIVLAPEEIKDQPFFRNAQKGDQTIVYPQAGLAILYRPTENRIIAVSTTTIQ